MFRKVIVQNGQMFTGSSRGSSFLVWPGILFVLFGVMIALMPRLLVVLVASFFIFIGILLISFGWKSKQVTSSSQTVWPD